MEGCKNAGWRIDHRLAFCNFCGSLRVRDAIRLLQTPGTRFSGSDWKYGWPHKFYIDNPGYYKFYTIHLRDANDTEFELFAKVSRETFGINWVRDEKGIQFQAPRSRNIGGWQLSGIIGPGGVPHFDEMVTITSDQLKEFFEKAS